MALLPGLVLEPARNLRRQGPETAAQFERPAPTKVLYRISSTLYTDTLSAGAVAVVWGGSTTTVDMTAANYVTFIAPQRGGAATLRIIAEADWHPLWLSEDVVPLDYCWLQGMRYYQPRVAMAALGASMTGYAETAGDVPIYLSTDLDNPTCELLEGWFHIPEAPGADTSVLQIDASGGGETRIMEAWLTADGHLLVTYWYEDGSLFAVQTLDAWGGRALAPDWYRLWFATSIEQIGDAPVTHAPGYASGYRVRLWNHEGETWGLRIPATSRTVAHNTYAGTVKLGAGSYAPWPDTTGWDLTTVEASHETLSGPTYIPTVPVVPTSSPSPEGDTLYTMIQPLGAASVIIDMSGNGHHAPVPVSAHIVADTPYPFTGPSLPMIDTIAGNGASATFPAGPVAATSFGLLNPSACCYDATGNLYFTSGNCIYRIDHGGTDATLYAGNTSNTAGYTGDGGAANVASLDLPLGMACDSTGDLYIADTNNGVVRKVDHTTGFIATIAGDHSLAGTNSGDGGPALAAGMEFPQSVCFDTDATLYIGQTVAVRKVDLSSGGHPISLYAGTYTLGNYGPVGGAATSCDIRAAGSVAIDSGGHLFIGDFDSELIFRVDKGTGFISLYAGTFLVGSAEETDPYYNVSWDGVDMSLGYHGNYIGGYNAGIGTNNQVVAHLALCIANDIIYYNDGRGLVRKIRLDTARVTTVAGVVGVGSMGVNPIQVGFAGDGGLAYEAILGDNYDFIGFGGIPAIDPMSGNLAFPDAGGILGVTAANNRIRLITHP